MYFIDKKAVRFAYNLLTVGTLAELRLKCNSTTAFGIAFCDVLVYLCESRSRCKKEGAVNAVRNRAMSHIVGMEMIAAVLDWKIRAG
jgi:hypothetical protein